MSKRSIYRLVLLFFVVAIALIIFRYRDHQANAYVLLERKGPSAETREWLITRNYATSLQSELKNTPDNAKAALSLATIFIQEARISGNYLYYDRAALKYVNDVLKKDSTNFDALTLKSLVYLSQHHFSDGLAIAVKAQQINPYNAFIYGILVDGNVEMGNYDSAVSNSDKMVSIRPDLRSYSRISYLREIYGDYPGAIQAMRMAVDAGAPGDESTEWSRIQLGRLYENTGDLKSAQMHYMIALDERPGYAYALAGLARIALASKDNQQAIAYYKKADSLVSDNSFREELSDVYQLSGQKAKADSLANLVIDALSQNAQSGRNDENIGHYADRELAYAYLKINNYNKALEHALIEYNRRPANIDVNETLAWVYYCKGEYANALPYLRVALKTNSKNPLLLCRAGLIYAKSGDKLTAKTRLLEALSSNANIAASLKTESLQTLKSL
jgi:tetratricopeptide (TPR) repeat protein